MRRIVVRAPACLALTVVALVELAALAAPAPAGAAPRVAPAAARTMWHVTQPCDAAAKLWLSLEGAGAERPTEHDFADLERELAARVRRTEWVVERRCTTRVLTATELDRSRRLAALAAAGGFAHFIQQPSAVTMTILGANPREPYWRGSASRFHVTLENTSPYRVSVAALELSGCGGTQATVALAPAVVLAPGAKAVREVVVTTVRAPAIAGRHCGGQSWTSPGPQPYTIASA